MRSDLRALFEEALPGIVVAPSQANFLRVQALISGPHGTPYEGGLFHFLLEAPPTYPAEPPKVKMTTTGGGVVRFNPNLYANGKVCLSVLGTWSGPSWTPTQTIGSVLLSIQSLLNERPYTNEPGFEKAESAGVVSDYNDVVAHETLRVAVLETVTNKRGPLSTALRHAALETFVALKDQYCERCDVYAGRLDGKPFRDPYGDNKGTFCFAELKRRLMEAGEEAGKELAEIRAAEGEIEEEK